MPGRSGSSRMRAARLSGSGSGGPCASLGGMLEPGPGPEPVECGPRPVSAGVDLDLAQLPQTIPQRRRLLELEALRRRPHLLLELGDALAQRQLEPLRYV